MKFATGQSKVAMKGVSNKDHPGNSSPVLSRMMSPSASDIMKNGKICII
jgi:hypothetical protein